MKHLSVVMPVHNEAHSLPTLYQELTAALQGDYELLLTYRLHLQL